MGDRPSFFRTLFCRSAARDKRRDEAVALVQTVTDDLRIARKELRDAVDDSQRRRVHDLDEYRRRALG